MSDSFNVIYFKLISTIIQSHKREFNGEKLGFDRVTKA